jgi:hypothetical protein
MDELKKIVDEHAERLAHLLQQYRTQKRLDCYDDSPTTSNKASKLLDDLLDAESDWTLTIAMDDRIKNYAQDARKKYEAQYGCK